MVQELKVTCPRCRQTADIFLSTNACVIILNCPSCCTPIMYFDRKIFLLTERQIQAIKNKIGNNSASYLKNGAVLPAKLPVKKNAAVMRDFPATYISSKDAVSLSNKYSKTAICEDDIVNLKIDLALCKDINDFLKKI